MNNSEILNAKNLNNDESIALVNLISNLSHDLRNPMSNIFNLSYLLRRELLNPTQITLIEGIESASDEIQMLLTLLLDFSKLNYRGLPACSEKFAISELIVQIVNEYKSLAYSKNIILAYVKQKKDLNNIFADKSYLYKLLQNILGLMVYSSKYSQITLDENITQLSEYCSVNFEILFQGSVEENQKLIQYFSEQINQAQFVAVPKSQIDLRLCLCSTFINLLKAQIDVCKVNQKTSQFIITIPLTPAGE